MDLPKYLDTLTPAQRKDFAARSGVTEGYLKQLKCRTPGNQHRVPSTKLCPQMVAASITLRAEIGAPEENVLTLAELRPTVWGSQVISGSAA
jgi:hypothetical protein